MDKRFHRAQVCLLLIWIFAIIFEWFSPERGSLLLRNLIAPVLFVFSGLWLARRRGPWRAEVLCTLALAAWYVVTRILNGPHYLETDYDNAWRLAMTAMLALPLGLELDEQERGKALKWLTALIAGGLAVIAWVAVTATVTGQPFHTPLGGREIGITEVYVAPRRLNVLDMHPNISAALFCLAFGMLLHLAASVRHRLWLIPIVIAGAGLYAAIALTVSRTAMIALALELGAFAYLLLSRVPWKPLVRTAAAVAAMLVIALGAYAGFDLSIGAMNTVAASLQSARPTEAAAAVVQPADSAAPEQAAEPAPVTLTDERELSDTLGTLSGRTTDIYPQVIPVLKDRPLTLLIGNSTDEVIKPANRRIGFNVYHWHNSFLQTLMTTGLPGLLAALGLSLLLIVQAARLFFSRKADLASQALVLPVAGAFLHAMLENLLFVTSALPNLLFMLLAGFVFAAARSICGPLSLRRRTQKS